LYLIVGIDPGTTTGIAALNFNGELIDLFSSRDLGMDGVIAHLIKLGKVSVVATDVTPTPNFVSKLAARLGAIVHTPHESISVTEKVELTRVYKTEDSHQRDALAAALITLNKFKNKFKKIDSLRLGDDVKHLVLQGHSIDDAVNMLKEKKKPKAIEKPKPRREVILPEGERRIRRLERQNILLKKQLEEKDKEIRELKRKILIIKNRYRKEIRKEAEIRKRDQRIKGLEASLNDLRDKLKDIDKIRDLWKILSEGNIKPIGVFPERYNGLTLIKRRLKKRDLEELDGIDVAFSSEPINYEPLLDRGILVTDTKYVKEEANLYYITTDDLKRLKSKRTPLEKIIEDYRKKRS